MRKVLGVIGGLCLVFSFSASVGAISVEVVQLNGEIPSMGSNPLGGVPQYPWYHGCSPTSGGMLMGYWDSHPSGDWSNLVEGDISSWGTTAQDMVASPEHIADYWGYPDPNPGGHLDNCLADFMHTSRSGEFLGDGGTWSDMIPRGLEDFALWDNPATATNESYYADSWTEQVGFYSGAFTWDAFKTAIDAETPMLLNLIEWGDTRGWTGHSVVGYGYQEDMFNLAVYEGSDSWENVTVGGFAIWDTWDTSSSQSSWLGWDGEMVNSKKTGGVEWWPFLDITLADGWSYNSSYWDWAVVEGVYFQPGSPVPEPGSWLLLGSGLLGIIIFGRRKRKFVKL